jgi:hypothetical protein
LRSGAADAKVNIAPVTKFTMWRAEIMKAWIVALFCPMLVLLMACSRPPILDSVQCDASTDCGAASHEFNSVVRGRFPIGSSESALEKELLAEGFERLYPASVARCTLEQELPSAAVGMAVVNCPSWDANWNPQHALVYRYSKGLGSACGYEAGVLWSSDEQKRITHIEGYYEARCI